MQTVSRKRRSPMPARKVSRRRIVRWKRLSPYRRDVHYFKRYSQQLNTISGNILHAPLTGGYAFRLSSVSQVGELTSLFDQFQMTYVKVYFHLKIDPSAQVNSQASFPRLFFCRDYDDSSSSFTLDDIRARSKTQIRVMNPNKPVVIGLCPAVLGQAYRGATTTSYIPLWKQWIDCDQSDTPHYGLKWAIDDLTNTNYQVNVEVKYWLKCRNTQ